MLLTVEVLTLIAVWCSNPVDESLNQRSVKICRKEAISCIDKIPLNKALEGTKEIQECLTKSVDKTWGK